MVMLSMPLYAIHAMSLLLLLRHASCFWLSAYMLLLPCQRFAVHCQYAAEEEGEAGFASIRRCQLVARGAEAAALLRSGARRCAFALRCCWQMRRK